MRSLTEITEKLIQYARKPADELRLAMLGRERTWQLIDGKFWMHLDPTDLMDQMFYIGSYDPLIVEIIRRWVRYGDTCVDVGAHKGYVTQHLAAAVGAIGHVYSFEPDPTVRGILEENRARNAFRHVVISPYALGKEESTMRYFLSRQSGWSSLFPNQLAGPMVAEEVEIPVRSFDALASSGALTIDRSRLRFVKIDCEGAEPLVLSGMQETLRHSSPMIWIEINDGSLRAAGSSIAELQRLVQDFGYALFVPGLLSPVHRRLVLRGTKRLEPGADTYNAVALRPEGVTELQERGIPTGRA